MVVLSLSFGENGYYTVAIKIQNLQHSREPVTNALVRVKPQNELDIEHAF